MPPDHGAAAVRIILEDAGLTADWREELDSMRARIVAIRAELAGLDPLLRGWGQQHGMFSTLPLSPEQVQLLAEEHAVYMPRSGRVNVAGLTSATAPAFVRAIRSVM
jgi:aromatic-amino-acid transaminase